MSEIGEVGKGQIMKGLSDNHKEFEFFSESNRKILEAFKQGRDKCGLHFEVITLAASWRMDWRETIVAES